LNSFATLPNGHVGALENGNNAALMEDVNTQTPNGIISNGDSDNLAGLALHGQSLVSNNKALESSTDTLTCSEEIADQALLLKSRRRFHSELAGPVAQRMEVNGDCESDEEDSGRLLKKVSSRRRQDLDKASMESLKLMIQKNCSISTSTTDISDSHVSVANGVASEVCARAGLFIRCNSIMCNGTGVVKNMPASSDASPSVCSLVHTPINSHTPSSTCSPTPGSEGKVRLGPFAFF
jgi:hypothetical protein